MGLISAFEKAVMWAFKDSANTAKNVGNTQIGIFNSILSLDIYSLKIQLTIGFFLILSTLLSVFGLIYREIKKERSKKDDERKKKAEKEKAEKERAEKANAHKEKAEKEKAEKERAEKERAENESNELLLRKKQIIWDHQARCPSCRKLGKELNRIVLLSFF